jgi:hypothetical protein
MKRKNIIKPKTEETHPSIFMSPAGPSPLKTRATLQPAGDFINQKGGAI